MSNSRAEKYIRQWQELESEASPVMSTYQQIANHFYPQHNNITKQATAGTDISLPIIDPHGIKNATKMAAGFSAIVFPAGQYFVRIIAADPDLADRENVRSYFARLTQVFHQNIYKSNFFAQANELIRGLTTFGTANLQSDFDVEQMRLRFKNWGVANFRFTIDAYDRPTSCKVMWKYTAEQAYELFGDDAGREIVQRAKDKKQPQEKFPFLFCTQRRTNRDYSKTDNLNYPFEMVAINVREKTIVYEGGFETFPYHIVRWLRGDDCQKWGFGQGSVALSLSKELQIQRRELILAGNLANSPPMQAGPTFEGVPKIYPKALNRVMEMDSVKALDTRLHGNFPITRETIEMTKGDIDDCFYIKTFLPLEGLPGDRRTTVEIIERVKAGYMQLVQPVHNFYEDFLTPCVERCVLLLLKYKMIPAPPPEIREFKVEYLGKLALALQEQQSDALIRFSQFSAQMEQVIPHFTQDNIHADRAGRRMATTFGVNEGDLTTEEERQAIRANRAQLEQQQMAMMAAQTGGDAYKNATTAPEKGSPAEALMAGANE